jgi:hypothetical protein
MTDVNLNQSGLLKSEYDEIIKLLNEGVIFWLIELMIIVVKYYKLQIIYQSLKLVADFFIFKNIS